MSLISQSEQAEALYKELLKYERVQRATRVLYGELLNQLKNKSLYKKAVGQGVDTWRDFLAMPEIGLSETDAKALMALSALGECNIPFTTLKVMSKKKLISEEQIHDAKHLTTKDFKERYHEATTNNAPQTYTYMVMKKSNETGNLTKVHEITSTDIEVKFDIHEETK